MTNNAKIVLYTKEADRYEMYIDGIPLPGYIFLDKKSMRYKYVAHEYKFLFDSVTMKIIADELDKLTKDHQSGLLCKLMHKERNRG